MQIVGLGVARFLGDGLFYSRYGFSMSARLGLQGGQGDEGGYVLGGQHQQFFVSNLGFGGSIAAPEQFAAVVKGIDKIRLQIQCCFKGGNGPCEICRSS